MRETLTNSQARLKVAADHRLGSARGPPRQAQAQRTSRELVASRWQHLADRPFGLFTPSCPISDIP
jgi:hypothetical protein